MPKINIKKIKEQAIKMRNAWNEGAPDVNEFKNVTKADFDADIAIGQALEDEANDLRAQLKMKDDQCTDHYKKINRNKSNVAEGVRGHKNYGDDSLLYGAMGFVRKSERKSGLTRKIKSNDDNNGDN